MPDTLHLDYETKSNVDLKKVGLDVYTLPVNKPAVLMAAYRINDQQLQQWEPHCEPIPAELVEALRDPEVERWAFNAQFERVVTKRVLKIDTPRRNWRCSMCLAYMHSFTGGLAEIGQQIGLPPDRQKMKTGNDLIRTFCIPQNVTKNFPHEWRNWVTDPEMWEEFCEYNQQDVITEEAIKRRLIGYPVLADEWEFYELDQLINDRGIPLDWSFVNNVIKLSDRRKTELIDEMSALTGLYNPNSVSQLLRWAQVQGYPYGDLQKENVEKALSRNQGLAGYLLTEECARVLEMRLWSSKTSIGKAHKARRTVGAGGRVRFLYQFAGASRTARFAGRGVQPQNMMRTPKMLDPEESDEKLTLVTELIRQGDYEGFDLLINEPMLAFTGAMRGMFRAPDGYQFTVCDYSSVESAGLGWVAKCQRLLDVFNTGRDPYRDFGTLFYNKPYDSITRAERQICKPPTLGCGYRLSAGAISEEGIKTGLLRYAENMGVEMMPEEAERAVKVFREGYPEIPRFWYDCEYATRYVLQTHQPYDLGYVRFEYKKPYLLIRLPSGRYIYYYKPLLRNKVFVSKRKKLVLQCYADPVTGEPVEKFAEEEETYTRVVFSYMGRNQKTTKWDRIDAHGGVTTENIVQALTRDILKVGLQRLHKAGFTIIGHSHDEAIVMTKIGDNYQTLELMRELMTQPIEWAPGFPLNAAGWQAPFYRK